jgi:hypothetical protein
MFNDIKSQLENTKLPTVNVEVTVAPGTWVNFFLAASLTALFVIVAYTVFVKPATR